jgi:hypothetical protein
MLLKIIEPFEVIEVESTAGKVTNITSEYHKYTVTENGIYLLSSLYSAQTIVEFFKKSATTINVYSTAPSVFFHPIESPDLTEAKWNEIKKFAYKVVFGGAFEMFDDTDFNEANSIYAPRIAQRQFLIFNIQNINGSVVINQTFESGMTNRELLKII